MNVYRVASPPPALAEPKREEVALAPVAAVGSEADVEDALAYDVEDTSAYDVAFARSARHGKVIFAVGVVIAMIIVFVAGFELRHGSRRASTSHVVPVR